MRKAFSGAVESLCLSDERVLFITGDLGFNAFENLKDKIGDRFINAGVAEQNMVTVAAGFAAEGFKPIIYSIAPFVALRPFEQIRNDIALHSLPVTIVGNGGGYGYGIMGATHHTIEDLAVLKGLPNFRCLIPITKADVDCLVREIPDISSPQYLRLNTLVDVEMGVFAPIRQVLSGQRGTILCLGSVVSNLVSLATQNNVSLWVCSHLPIPSLPDVFIKDILRTKMLWVIEEHGAHGGLGQEIVWRMKCEGIDDFKFHHSYARGYPSGRYGSQKWHQSENRLFGANLEEDFSSFVKDDR